MAQKAVWTKWGVMMQSVPDEAPAASAAPTAGGAGLPGAARTAWEQAIAQYGPEGGFGKGVEAGLERGRTKAVSSGMQSLVSAGLAGTTQAAGLGKRYEEEVAMPTRARVEETRAQAVAGLQAGLAGAEQRGYETAEDRALRERISTRQISAQRDISGGQAGLGYAQLRSRERLSAQQLALREQASRAKTEQRGGENFYAQPAGGYGGGPAGQTATRQPLTWGETFRGTDPAWRAEQEKRFAGY